MRPKNAKSDLIYLKEGYWQEREPFSSGNYSDVYRAYYQDPIKNKNSLRAIKVLKKNHLLSEKVLELQQTEIMILKNCRNRNVVKLYEVLSDESNGNILMVLKYCDGRVSRNDPIKSSPLSLADYLKVQKQKRLPEEEVIFFLTQFLNGFNGLHQLDAMHRDFKPSNVLFHKGRIKIADLGFAKQRPFADTPLGTRGYMAPEIEKARKMKKPYTNKVDIYSIGITLFEMLFGFHPYDNKIIPKDMGVKISVEMRDLLQKMLIEDPDERIDWLEIYEHDVFKKRSSLEAQDFSLNKMYSNQSFEEMGSQTVFEKNKQFYIEKRKEKMESMTDPFEILLGRLKNDPTMKTIPEVPSFAERSAFPPAKVSKDSFRNAHIKQDSELQLLEKLYLFDLNMVRHLGRILNESIINFERGTNIHFLFVWAKLIRGKANNFLLNLIQKKNIYSSPVFQLYLTTQHFRDTRDKIIIDSGLAHEQFNLIKNDAKNFITEYNPEIKPQLEAHYANDELDLSEQLWKFCVYDYVDKLRNKVIGKGPKEKRKAFVHLVMVLDAYFRKKRFLFSEAEKSGFDFDRYCELINERSEEELDAMIEKSLELLFSNENN